VFSAGKLTKPAVTANVSTHKKILQKMKVRRRIEYIEAIKKIFTFARSTMIVKIIVPR
jgi:hypothetical protein